MTDKRIEKNLPSIGKITEKPSVVPIGIPPILRRFWNFAKEMSKRFSKHLLKNREEEFLKAVVKDFEKGE